jgi:hypothetical protein
MDRGHRRDRRTHGLLGPGAQARRLLGECVRRLAYDRDQEGWLELEGAPQPWEPAYFFGGSASPDQEHCPDMLDDELPDDDLARYEHARRTGDPTSVMDLLHPSSMSPMLRVCTFFGIDPDRPSGRWKKPSFWSRLFRVSA